MNTGNPVKVYVHVNVSFDRTGHMVPRFITWEDGKRYEIEKVTDIRPAPALKAGGRGDRYTIWINGQRSYVYFERFPIENTSVVGRWFVERKGA